jgi:hypothetical protein
VEYAITRLISFCTRPTVAAKNAVEAPTIVTIINNLPKSNATGIAGKLVRVAVESKTVFQVEDWDQFRGYLVSHQKKNPGVWGLMNKAANQAGIKELWESGVKVPGVAALKVPTLSVNKL